MSHQHATLEDTVYFGFVSNDTSGSAADGTTPLFDVRLGGAVASAAPVLSGTPDLLTHANYGPGAYEVAVDATAGNGFATGNTYLVYTTVTADGQTPGSCLGSFTLAEVPADVTEWAGTDVVAGAIPAFAADAAGGLPVSDAGGLDLDTQLAATNEVTAARMSELDAATAGKMANQVDEIRTDTGEIGAAGAGLTNINLPNQTMDIVGDITGNLSGSVGSVTGAVGSVTGNVGGNVVGSVASVTAEVSADVTKISGSTAAADNLEESAEAIITGTAQTGTLSTTQMTSDLSGYADSELVGRTVIWKSGTADGQASDITAYASASGLVTFTAITTAPANGDLFVIV